MIRHGNAVVDGYQRLPPHVMVPPPDSTRNVMPRPASAVAVHRARGSTPLLTDKMFCAIALVAIVMATSMQNAENTYLNFNIRMFLLSKKVEARF